MGSRDSLLARWLTLAMAGCARQTIGFLVREEDPFRNPVGQLLKKNLDLLLQELFGDMDRSVIKTALRAVIQLRALQGLAEQQVAGFVFSLRALVVEEMPRVDVAWLDDRIDQLAALAADEYTRCRERLEAVRLDEMRRACAVPAMRLQARS